MTFARLTWWVPILCVPLTLGLTVWTQGNVWKTQRALTELRGQLETRTQQAETAVAGWEHANADRRELLRRLEHATMLLRDERRLLALCYEGQPL